MCCRTVRRTPPANSKLQRRRRVRIVRRLRVQRPFTRRDKIIPVAAAGDVRRDGDLQSLTGAAVSATYVKYVNDMAEHVTAPARRLDSYDSMERPRKFKHSNPDAKGNDPGISAYCTIGLDQPVGD